MKSILILALLFSSFRVFSQPPPMQEIILSFSGEVKPSENKLTPSMKEKILKQLKISKSADYSILSAAVGAGYVAVVQNAKNREQLAWVYYEGSEGILQTILFKSMINAVALGKVKAVAAAKGLKADQNTDYLKISNKTGTWYKIAGTVDGAFGFIFLSEGFVFLSKEGEEH